MRALFVLFFLLCSSVQSYADGISIDEMALSEIFDMKGFALLVKVTDVYMNTHSIGGMVSKIWKKPAENVIYQENQSVRLTIRQPPKLHPGKWIAFRSYWKTESISGVKVGDSYIFIPFSNNYQLLQYTPANERKISFLLDPNPTERYLKNSTPEDRLADLMDLDMYALAYQAMKKKGELTHPLLFEKSEKIERFNLFVYHIENSPIDSIKPMIKDLRDYTTKTKNAGPRNKLIEFLYGDLTPLRMELAPLILETLNPEDSQDLSTLQNLCGSYIGYLPDEKVKHLAPLYVDLAGICAKNRPDYYQKGEMIVKYVALLSGDDRYQCIINLISVVHSTIFDKTFDVDIFNIIVQAIEADPQERYLVPLTKINPLAKPELKSTIVPTYMELILQIGEQNKKSRKKAKKILVSLQNDHPDLVSEEMAKRIKKL